MLRLRRDYPQLERPYRVPGGRLIPGVAVASSLAILGVMVLPGSPAALAWPLEITILAAFVFLGIGFWRGGARIRRRVTEMERAYLILEDFADL